MRFPTRAIFQVSAASLLALASCAPNNIPVNATLEEAAQAIRNKTDIQIKRPTYDICKPPTTVFDGKSKEGKPISVVAFPGDGFAIVQSDKAGVIADQSGEVLYSLNVSKDTANTVAQLGKTVLDMCVDSIENAAKRAGSGPRPILIPPPEPYKPLTPYSPLQDAGANGATSHKPDDVRQRMRSLVLGVPMS